MRGIVKILIFLGIGLLLLFAALMNSEQRVTLTLFPGLTLHDVPVFMVILGAMFVGVLVAGAVTAVDQLRVRARTRDLRDQLDAARVELRELRNLPIGKDDPSAGSSG